MPTDGLFDLGGKKALVTGGATGIGRSCALALAHAGADVAIADRNEASGSETVEAIQHLGRHAIFLPCDVAEAAQVQSMIHGVAERFARLDIAVNSAGIFQSGDDESYGKDDWDRVIGINLTGTWLCAQAAMNLMIKKHPVGGKIINIASIGAHIACSNGAYDASKAGVVHLTKTLAARWGRYNINVNSISPGYVSTAFGNSRTSEERKRLREMTPLGHVQRAADLRGTVVFFASRASDYVTGQDLVVDGGHTLSTWMMPLERSVPARIDPSGEIE